MGILRQATFRRLGLIAVTLFLSIVMVSGIWTGTMAGSSAVPPAKGLNGSVTIARNAVSGPTGSLGEVSHSNASSGASPPVGEAGTLVGRDYYPDGSWENAYDPADGDVYVANWSGSDVLVFNGTHQVATINVGTYPTGVAYDSATKTIWVTNQVSGNVSIIQNFSVTRSIPLPSYTPLFITYVPDIESMFITTIIASGGDLLELCGNGSSASTNVGTTPQGLAYDPENQFLYVANYGSDTVSIFNVSKNLFPFKAVRTIGVGAGPLGVAYSPTANMVFVTNELSNNVTGISGDGVYYPSITAGTYPDGAFYVPASGGLYVMNQGSSNIYVYSANLALLETIAMPAPTWAAYDPASGVVYVESLGGGWGGSLVSVLLGATPATTTLGGHNVQSIDVGQSVYAETTLYAVGTEAISTSATVSPGSGLGCDPNPTGPAQDGVISTACTAFSPGTYTIWLNITDNDSSYVQTYTTLTVDPAPAVTLSASDSGGIDLGQRFTLWGNATGGSGVFSYVWHGLPPGCASNDTSTLSCTPTAVGTYSAYVSAVDSNGNQVVSSAVTITVNPALSAVTVSASPLMLDVGQSLTVSASVHGGSGGYAYAWTSLPTGCQSTTEPTLTCEPDFPGSYSVGVSATDSLGATSLGSPVVVTVSPALSVTNLSVSKAILDLGSALILKATVTGGSGGLTYKWSGLTAGCSSSDNSSLTCSPTAAGTFWISLSATDSNGVTSTAGPVSFTVNTPLGTPAVAETSTSVNTGQEVVFYAGVTGGSGPYQYSWSGLPAGCSGDDTASVSCFPTTTGTSTVTVTVTDATGTSQTSAGASISVTAAPTTQSVSSLNLPLYAVIGLVAVTLVVALLNLIVRRPQQPPKEHHEQLPAPASAPPQPSAPAYPPPAPPDATYSPPPPPPPTQ